MKSRSSGNKMDKSFRLGKRGGTSPKAEDNANKSFLKIDLPDSVVALVEKDLGGVEKLKIAMASDMLPGGDFGEQWLLVADERIAVAGHVDGHVELIHSLEFGEKDKLLVKPGISTAVVDLQQESGRHRILRISNALQKDYSEATRLINDWIKKKEWNPEIFDARRHACSNCGRPLSKGMKICPLCVDKRKMIRKVLSFLAPYRLLVMQLFLLMIVTTLVGLVNPYIGKILIDDVIRPLKNMHWLPFLAGAMILIYAAQTGLQMFNAMVSSKLGTHAIYDIRATMFNRLQELSLSFYSKHEAGGLITRVNQDTGQLQKLLVDFIPYGISSIFMTVGILVILFYMSAFLTLFVLVPVVVSVIFIYRVFPRFRIYWQRYFEKRSRLASFVNDVITGIRVVKAFAQEDAELTRFNEQNKEYRDSAYEAEIKWAKTMPVIQMLTMVGTPIVWFVGGRLIFKGEITLGTVIAYTGYLTMLFRPVFILTRLAQDIPNTLAAAGRVFEIIDAEPEIADASDAIAMPEMEGNIEFRNVTFGYDMNKPVLEDVSFKIDANEMVGLVGHSGAGKSTIINLVCRLFDVDEGEVLVDGVDVRKIRYEDLRKHIGIVMQETFLLNGTIAENIAYARPEATVEKIIDAAKVANAHEFIISKPDGYDTEVKQGGANLSVGEKQRISIARAVICDPTILILDEATGSVDLKTEKEIQDALARLIKERTTIAIAHRLTTLKKADRLFVVDKGELKEMGTHEELVKKKGIYSKLVKLQTDLSQIRGVA